MTPAQQRIYDWRLNPVQFVWDNFKIEPDAWQKEALEVFPSQDKDKLRISLQACTGPGKSAVLSWMGWNFISTYCIRSGEHPKGACLSVTAQNLQDNLWAEFPKWQARSPFLTKAFEWNKSRIAAREHPETWFLSARSFAKKANSEEQGRTLSGLHAECVLVLIDESGDIPLPVLKTADQIFDNYKWAKVVQAGNPTSLEGILYAAATTLRDQWHIIVITGDPDDPRRSPRINIDRAREKIAKWGREDAWVMSTVLGRFPPSSINALLGPDEVYAAMDRHLSEDQYSFAQKRLGVDVARFGDDSTILFPRQGLATFPCTEMRGARNTEVADRILMAKRRWNFERLYVDGTGGFGAGVIDRLRTDGLNAYEYLASGKPNSDRYYNKRAEVMFEQAEWIKRGGSLPMDTQLAKELVAPTYTFKDSKILVEAKDHIKMRLGYSPDRADAHAMTFSQPDMPATTEWDRYSGTKGKLLHEYDPFAEKESDQRDYDPFSRF